MFIVGGKQAAAPPMTGYRREALRLFRHVLRTARLIPDGGARIYYRNHAFSKTLRPESASAAATAASQLR